MYTVRSNYYTIANRQPWKTRINHINQARSDIINKAKICRAHILWDVLYMNWGLVMMTSSNGNISALLALCAGNSPVSGEFPAQRPVTRSFDVFFDLRLNKQLSEQSCGWWFERPSRSLWCHSNDWGLVCQRQVSRVGTSNYDPQWCNFHSACVTF